MRFGSVFFAFALLVQAVAPAAADDDPLTAMRAAMACAAWSGLRAYRADGTRDADSLHGDVHETVDVRTGRYIFSTRNNVYTRAEGFAGASQWVRDRSGASHALNAPHARALARTDAWLRRRGWCAVDRGGTTLIRTALHTENGRAYDIVTATPAGGAPVELWVDRSTHLLERTVEQLPESRLIEHFDDWRTVDGTVIAFERRDVYPEDEAVEVTHLRSVERLSNVAPTIFTSPPLPRDAEIVGALSTSFPYRFDGGKIIVDVRVNGQGPFPFVLDTGGHLILTPATARRLGIQPAGSASSLGQGEAVLKAGFARVREIRVGGARMSNQVAKILPLGYRRLERGPRPPKAGWLGLELFERFATTIDPNVHRITLARIDRPRPVPRGARIPIVFDEDAPHVRCAIASHPGLCMVDTGNATATIVEGYWAKRSRLSGQALNGIDIGDGYTATRVDVVLGSIRRQREAALFAPQAKRGSEATTVTAAILSEEFLNRFVMTIDYGRGAMWLLAADRAMSRPFDRTGIEADKQPGGSFKVWNVLKASPAMQAGIKVRDIIVAIDGTAAKQFSGTDLEELGEGPIGSTHVYSIAGRGSVRRIPVRLRELLP